MRRGLRDERGITTVEFAVLLPVLMLLLVGIIQIGVYIFTIVDVRQATREGGRQLTILRNDSSGEQEVESKVAASLGGEVSSGKLTYGFSTPPPWAPGSTVTL